MNFSPSPDKRKSNIMPQKTFFPVSDNGDIDLDLQPKPRHSLS